jgi:hypothetical protein
MRSRSVRTRKASGERFPGRLAALLVLSALAFSVAAPARADTDDEAFNKYQGDGHIWSAKFEGRGYAPFVRIPYEVLPGWSYSRTEVTSLPGRCFGYAAPFYIDEIGEEFVQQDLSPSGSQNPTARAENPENVKNQKKGTWPPGGGVEHGIRATAECPSKLSGKTIATWTDVGDNQNHLGVSTSKTNATMDTAKQLLTGEASGVLHDVTVGSLSIDRVESWLKVDMAPNGQPVVSYRLGLFGAHKPGASSEQGVVLAGNNLVGEEVARQFKEQVNQHGKDLAQLGSYQINVVSPTVTNHGNYYFVQAPVFEVDIQDEYLKDRPGESFGVRLGETRFSGIHLAGGSGGGGSMDSNGAGSDSSSPSPSPSYG